MLMYSPRIVSNKLNKNDILGESVVKYMQVEYSILFMLKEKPESRKEINVILVVLIITKTCNSVVIRYDVTDH